MPTPLPDRYSELDTASGSRFARSGPIALAAARVSLDLGLPMADAVILATARAWKATWWTQDNDFEGVPAVKYVAKR